MFVYLRTTTPRIVEGSAPNRVEALLARDEELLALRAAEETCSCALVDWMENRNYKAHFVKMFVYLRTTTPRIVEGSAPNRGDFKLCSAAHAAPRMDASILSRKSARGDRRSAELARVSGRPS